MKLEQIWLITTRDTPSSNNVNDPGSPVITQTPGIFMLNFQLYQIL